MVILCPTGQNDTVPQVHFTCVHKCGNAVPLSPSVPCFLTSCPIDRVLYEPSPSAKMNHHIRHIHHTCGLITDIIYCRRSSPTPQTLSTGYKGWWLNLRPYVENVSAEASGGVRDFSLKTNTLNRVGPASCGAPEYMIYHDVS